MSEKNYPLQPDEVNAKSRKNVWWHCKKCGNEWKSVINARIKGTACPVCAEEKCLQDTMIWRQRIKIYSGNGIMN